VERRHDLVVLAQGIVAAWDPKGVIDLSVADDGFLQRPQAKLNPSYTTMEGVFMAGVAAGPKDIPDAIVEAGEAAMSAAIHLYRSRGRAPAAEHAMAH
jgi:heterodisulfide reductase subunit A